MWNDKESDKDFLSFSDLSDQILALITNQSLYPISVGVFGGWGTGKSTVLRLLENQLPGPMKGGPILVKFDAWLYQGFDDARAALMEVVSDAILAEADRRKTFVDQAREFAARVNYFRALGTIADFGVGAALGIPPGLLTRAGTAISSIFAGLGESEHLEQLKDDAKQVVSSLTGLVKPAAQRTPPKEIAEFRDQFGTLLTNLKTTLIIFIDNLDRCLPDVAISTLESVRLFLFIPQTAFVIAADESMIRHSVSKHFGGLDVSHARDYLDKVIQVPLRVPQVGVEELRAYVYSLFVLLAAPSAIDAVQSYLVSKLRSRWKGESFEQSEIVKLAGEPADLLDNLAIADRLAPVLASASNVRGNPRIVKRLMNTIFLRRLLAKQRGMSVDLATLAKIAVFERCTNEEASVEMYRLILEGPDVHKYLSPRDALKGEQPPMPEAWKPFEKFIDEWTRLDPIFDKKVDLKPAVFLSREILAPSRMFTGLSQNARNAIEALVKVTGINSPGGTKIAKQLTEPERRVVMTHLIDSMREADWAQNTVTGLHGSIVLGKESEPAKDALKAFVASLPKANLNKTIQYLLKQSDLLE